VVRGSWFVVRGSWFVVRGSWFVAGEHMSEPVSPDRLQRMVVQALESAQRAGVTHLLKPSLAPKVVPAVSVTEAPVARPPLSSTADNTTTAKCTPAVASSPTLATAPKPPAAESLGSIASKPLEGSIIKSPVDRRAALQIIQHEVAACVKCSELASTRTQTVFGVGDPMARLCFVGEAPGADEDEQGEPFVGRAGQLLTKIIEACKLRREDVYILNVLKCRPPNNRTPLPTEVFNCRGFLDRQLSVIRPEYICCLGGVAAQTLLETDRGIGQLRGKFHDYRGIPVMCTYHPAYLLRNPSAKREVWDDMKKLMLKLGVVL